MRNNVGNISLVGIVPTTARQYRAGCRWGVVPNANGVRRWRGLGDGNVQRSTEAGFATAGARAAVHDCYADHFGGGGGRKRGDFQRAGRSAAEAFAIPAAGAIDWSVAHGAWRGD